MPGKERIKKQHTAQQSDGVLVPFPWRVVTLCPQNSGAIVAKLTPSPPNLSASGCCFSMSQRSRSLVARPRLCREPTKRPQGTEPICLGVYILYLVSAPRPSVRSEVLWEEEPQARSWRPVPGCHPASPDCSYLTCQRDGSREGTTQRQSTHSRHVLLCPSPPPPPPLTQEGTGCSP